MTKAGRLQLGAMLLAVTASSCSPPAPEQAGPVRNPLPQPTIVMEASPPPPFTYWAPEGGTIRNHVDVPGIWVAYLNGRNVAIYYGDQCRASEYQNYVGQPLKALPPAPSGVEVRTSCEGCPVNSDLRPNRMNVFFNEPATTIVQIACF